MVHSWCEAGAGASALNVWGVDGGTASSICGLKVILKAGIRWADQVSELCASLGPARRRRIPGRHPTRLPSAWISAVGPLSPSRAGARGPGCSSSGPAWCVYVGRGAPTAATPTAPPPPGVARLASFVCPEPAPRRRRRWRRCERWRHSSLAR